MEKSRIVKAPHFCKSNTCIESKIGIAISNRINKDGIEFKNKKSYFVFDYEDQYHKAKIKIDFKKFLQLMDIDYENIG